MVWFICKEKVLYLSKVNKMPELNDYHAYTSTTGSDSGYSGGSFSGGYSTTSSKESDSSKDTMNSWVKLLVIAAIIETICRLSDLFF